MNDELDNLKELVERESRLRRAPIRAATPFPKPWCASKHSTEAARQGLPPTNRLKAAASAACEALFRRRSMRLPLALAGSASLAVLAFAIINTAQFKACCRDLRAASAAASLRRRTPADFSADIELRENDAAPNATSPVRLATAPAAMADKAKAAIFYRSRDDDPGYQEQAPGAYRDQGRDRFTDIVPNPVKIAASEPVSTFSIDVDTASYAFVRASLNNNVLPQKDAVRVEEMVNYFPYDYAGPADRAEPFKASVSVFPTPWNPDTRLLHVGIKGFTLDGQDGGAPTSCS